MQTLMNSKLRRWLIIAISEIVISLILIAIAPAFLNSQKPIFGFLIWFTVPTVIGSSRSNSVSLQVGSRTSR